VYSVNVRRGRLEVLVSGSGGGGGKLNKGDLGGGGGRQSEGDATASQGRFLKTWRLLWGLPECRWWRHMFG